MSWLWLIVAAVVGVLAYVRLAPTDVGHVHCAVEGAEDADGEGHCVRVVSADEGTLGRLDAAMMALPRTVRIAGSVAEGRVSYVTRSKLVGFPDFTTIERNGDAVRMFARLRFGKSDFGVNRARLEHLKKAAL